MNINKKILQDVLKSSKRNKYKILFEAYAEQINQMRVERKTHPTIQAYLESELEMSFNSKTFYQAYKRYFNVEPRKQATMNPPQVPFDLKEPTEPVTYNLDLDGTEENKLGDIFKKQ